MEAVKDNLKTFQGSPGASLGGSEVTTRVNHMEETVSV